MNAFYQIKLPLNIECMIPNHATIARFGIMHFSPVSELILSKITHLLKECGEISCDAIFIDGTKIEATSNKYTLVWKRSVTKNLQKMMEKIPALFEFCEQEFQINVVYRDEIKLYHLKKLYKKLKNIRKMRMLFSFTVQEKENLSFKKQLNSSRNSFKDLRIIQRTCIF